VRGRGGGGDCEMGELEPGGGEDCEIRQLEPGGGMDCEIGQLEPGGGGAYLYKMPFRRQLGMPIQTE